jgi:hypothetical protein
MYIGLGRISYFNVKIYNVYSSDNFHVRMVIPIINTEFLSLNAFMFYSLCDVVCTYELYAYDEKILP